MVEPAMLPDPLTVAETLMAPGERLIWADRPRPKEGRRRALPMLLFGLVFCGMAVFWTVTAWAAGEAIAAFGVPFVIMGAAIALAPLWRPARAHDLVYAISDQRLLIIAGWPARHVRSFAPADINILERRERADGSGDLVFRRERAGWRTHRWHDERRRRPRMHDRLFGFFGIADVRRVEEAVRALQASGRPPTPPRAG